MQKVDNSGIRKIFTRKYPMYTMYQQITVKTLAKQHQKHSDIAAEMGCHRNTVTNILKRKEVIEKQVRDRSSGFNGYHEQIRKWLDKKVSRRRMYELITGNSEIAQTYDCLCKYIQQHFPKTPQAFGVLTTQPGETAEVDFGYAGLKPINLPGETLRFAKTWFLSVRLNHSRLAYREMTHDQKVSTFTTGITHAFEFFGGVPKRLKIDNLRAGVVKNQHYDLQFNPDFLDWANYYGVVINPCAPYHPEQKGGVESDIKYIANNFLVERHFSDWNDLSFQFKTWSNEYANKRIHGVTKKVPNEVFRSEEKATLQALPSSAFAVYNRCERKVGSNCHVFFQNHYYSVPAKLVGKLVTLRFSDTLIRITYLGEEIACHLMSKEVGAFTTCRSHLPNYKCYGVTEYQQKNEAKMADIGEFAHQYFQQILVKHDQYWFRSVRIILGLAHEYGNQAVNLSLERALAYKVTDAAMVKRIVVKQFYLLDKAPNLLKAISKVGTVPTNNLAAAITAASIPSIPSTFLSQVLTTIKDHLLPLGFDSAVKINSAISPSGIVSQSHPTNSAPSLNRDLGYYQQLLEN